jgi:hypothetical protein
MSKLRKCHICGTETDVECPTCVENFETRTPAENMSILDRVKELRLLAGPLEIPFSMLHKRIEELFGRPVWTHELACFTQMIDELEKTGKTEFIDPEKVIPKEKLIYVTH